MDRVMDGWNLGKDGFVMEYMTAGPSLEAFSSDMHDEDQLQLEGRLRKAVCGPRPETVKLKARLGETAPNGCPWRVYAPYGNGIIDVSAFYSTLQKIRVYGAAVLIAPKEMKVKARVWGYMAVGVYVNGRLAGGLAYPDYKPIQYCDLELTLEEGRNQILFICENLGARDTRNIVGLQILDHREEIRTGLADEGWQEAVAAAKRFLDGMTVEGSRIRFSAPAPAGTRCCPVQESPDYEVMHQPVVWEDVTGRTEVEIPETVRSVQVAVGQGGMELSRTLEAASHKKPRFRPAGTDEQAAWMDTMEGIAAVSSLNRGEFGFAIFNVLARKYLGREGERDREHLFETLELIRRRVDCSDFIVCGFLRYMHCYPVDDELRARAKEVLLDYRYWMNMEGTDAMCFWSENHALMFYAAAMDAGNTWPDAYFTRAKMTGAQLKAYGEDKLRQWLSDVEEYGYEEFLSAVYTCVTLGALLHVIDFAEEDIAARARAAADLLLTQVSRHVFKGTMIAPMGRVYREVIYPFDQGSQSMVSLIDTAAPYSYGEGWLALLATSSYRFPAGLLQLTKEAADCTYTSGNARIRLEKTEDYCLTSVESPRQDAYVRWHNERIDGSWTDSDTHAFTKSLNECFHGTSCFQPGVYGYQQHMWYAALSPEAVIFTNHPGTWSERSSMRPGYWNGNGVMPAIRQEKGILGAVYRIPEEHPVSFTHIYCPAERFDQVRQEGKWLFMQKGGGYLALWSSQVPEAYNDTIFGCEMRVYDRDTAYLCVCGSAREDGSLEDFAQAAKEKKPAFDPETGVLTAAGGFRVEYHPVKDMTQYVE